MMKYVGNFGTSTHRQNRSFNMGKVVEQNIMVRDGTKPTNYYRVYLATLTLYRQGKENQNLNLVVQWWKLG